MDEVSQAIGQLQGRMDAADARAERMEGKLDTQNEKLDRLLAAYERQRGARRATAVAVTGGGSVAGAFIGWLITWWTTKP